jgi:hypothetical protein
MMNVNLYTTKDGRYGERAPALASILPVLEPSVLHEHGPRASGLLHLRFTPLITRVHRTRRVGRSCSEVTLEAARSPRHTRLQDFFHSTCYGIWNVEEHIVFEENTTSANCRQWKRMRISKTQKDTQERCTRSNDILDRGSGWSAIRK